MKPISRDQHVEFVPSCDRDLPEEEQTRFHVRPFTHQEYRNITARLGEQIDVANMSLGQKGADVVYDGARAALCGWTNFDAPFETEKVGLAFGVTTECATKAAVEPIPFNVLSEIFGFAMSDCQLSEDDRKNS